MTTKEINWSRKEKRFALPSALLDQLLNAIDEAGMKSLEYSGRAVTQTVYFLDDEQHWSMGVSFKARRYIEDRSARIFLFDLKKSMFRFEIKKESTGMEAREKKHFGPIYFGQGLAHLGKSIFRIRPYLVIEYRRRHFVFPDSEEWCRITVDSDMRIWVFPKGATEAVCVRDCQEGSDLIRLEIKVSNAGESDSCVQMLLGGLFKLGVQPIISKKMEGLGAVKLWLDQTYANPLVKELKNCEIESKMTISPFVDPNVLFTRLKLFCHDGIRPFSVDRTYPFTMTTSSVNHYWSVTDNSQKKEGLKILYRGLTARPVLKSDTKIICPELGLIERCEVKDKPFSTLTTSFADVVKKNEAILGQLQYVGYLFRTRKAIWLINEQNGRVYHISLDKCSAHDRKDLFQIEVECSGKLRSCAEKEGIHPNIDETRGEIIEETKFLTRRILDFARERGIGLHPGEEKFQWLVG